MMATPGGVSGQNEEYDCGGSCHTQPSTATITMWASAHQLAPGADVDVVVNVSGGQAVDIMGVMIVSVTSPVSSSIPTVNGWVIKSDPEGTTFNYNENTTYSGSVSMRWQLSAPSIPGTYSLFARIMHGGGAAYAEDYSTGLTFLVGSISSAGPTVLVTAPAAGATVKGVVPLDVTVLDDVSIQYVSVKLDGVEIANKSTGPYTWSLESTIYKDGNHTINVTAVDVNGHTGFHEQFISISNSALNSSLLSWVWSMAAGTVAILAWVGVFMVVALMVRRRHMREVR